MTAEKWWKHQFPKMLKINSPKNAETCSKQLGYKNIQNYLLSAHPDILARFCWCSMGNRRWPRPVWSKFFQKIFFSKSSPKALNIIKTCSNHKILSFREFEEKIFFWKFSCFVQLHINFPKFPLNQNIYIRYQSMHRNHYLAHPDILTFLLQKLQSYRKRYGFCSISLPLLAT